MEGKLVLVVRHGERNDFVPLHMRIPNTLAHDEPLTELGHEQAELMANAIDLLIPEGSSVHIASSYMLRCIQTIGKLAMKKELPIHLVGGFSETFECQKWDYNPFEHLQIKIDADKHRRDYTDVRFIEEHTTTMPKYPESSSDLTQRICSVLMEYIRSREEDVIVIASHWGPIEALVRDFSQEHSDIRVPYTSITTLAYHNGSVTLLKAVDSSHIPMGMDRSEHHFNFRAK